MSKAKTNGQTDEEQHWSAYSQFVLDNSEVCSQCHSRTHKTIASYDASEMKKSLRGVLTTRIEKTKVAGQDFRGKHKQDSVHAFSSEYSSGSTSYCKRCGSDGWAYMEGDLPLNLVEDFGKNLYNRMEEIDGLTVGKDALMDEIRRLKQEPSMQGDDHYIFHKAVDNVVEVDHSELPEHD